MLELGTCLRFKKKNIPEVRERFLLHKFTGRQRGRKEAHGTRYAPNFQQAAFEGVQLTGCYSVTKFTISESITNRLVLPT